MTYGKEQQQVLMSCSVAQGIGVASGARLAHGNGNVTFAAVNRSGNYNVL